MKRLLLFVATLAISAPLWAQIGLGTARLSWTNPLTYTDGSSLSLSFIYVERSHISPVGPYARIASLGPAMLASETYDDTGLYNGTYYWQVIAEGNEWPGVESSPSNSASKVIALGGSNDPPKPQAPSNLTVQ